MSNVVIVGARRTPIGSLGGSLSALAAHQLGAIAMGAALRDAGVEAAEIDETILGQVLTAGAGMNPARQAARTAGISDTAPALTVNQVCGSGLRAVALGVQQITEGTAEIVVSGGQESMTNAPHVATIRGGKKLGDMTLHDTVMKDGLNASFSPSFMTVSFSPSFMTLHDTVMKDGLNDAFYGYPMGTTAENIAGRHAIDRSAQDEFAVASQQKASAASRSKRFADEIAPVTIETRKGPQHVDVDEFIRHDASLDALAKLRPAFREDGTVTAGNSSGINDGAAAMVLMSDAAARDRGLAALARIAGWAHAGLDPQFMGLGPIPATRKLLDRVGWSIGAVDLWEINEAFAAQSLAVISELGIAPDRVNVNGGAIALGHPIGASGARVLVTLLHEMRRRSAQRGIATLCIGGGMGIAMAVEHV